MSREEVQSAYEIITEISNLVDTFFLIILISLDFFNFDMYSRRSAVIV